MNHEHVEKQPMPAVQYYKGSVLQWVFIYLNGPENIVRVDCTMKLMKYQNISIKSGLFYGQSGLSLGLTGWYNSKQLAGPTQKWFNRPKISLLYHSSQTKRRKKKVLGWIKSREHNRVPKTSEDLEWLCTVEWGQILLSVL